MRTSAVRGQGCATVCRRCCSTSTRGGRRVRSTSTVNEIIQTGATRADPPRASRATCTTRRRSSTATADVRDLRRSHDRRAPTYQRYLENRLRRELRTSTGCRSGCGSGPQRADVAVRRRRSTRVAILCDAATLEPRTGRGAAWLARLTGGQKVAGSNPAGPTDETGRAEPAAGSSRRVLTVPNVISSLRIALIPVFVALIVDPDTTHAGVVLFAVVVATDWVDGTIARTDRPGHRARQGPRPGGRPARDRRRPHRAGDPRRSSRCGPASADPRPGRRGPAGRARTRCPTAHVRLDVRWIGKVATFSLMVAVPAIVVGRRSTCRSAPPRSTSAGCASRSGIVEYYIAAWAYARDARERCARRHRGLGRRYRSPTTSSRRRIE